MVESKISVIIPVYNGQKTIRACLDSIFRNQGPDYEVMVVDDGSTDATLSMVRQYPCSVIALSENKGPAFARNRAIEQSCSSHLLFTDADCIVDKNWMSIALTELLGLSKNNPLIVGAVGRILPQKGFFNKCDAYTAYGYNQNLKPGYTNHFCTANVIIARDKFLEVEQFNERLSNYEDLEVGIRLINRGYQLYYQPKFSVIHHPNRNNLKGFLSHEYEWGRKTGTYFEINYPNYHRTPLSPWMGNFYVYLLSAPFFALFITFKIIFKNIFFDPFVVMVAPLILLSKLLFRVGSLKFIRQTRSLRREEVHG